MKTSKALLLCLLALSLRADTTNFQVAWDFRDGHYKTIEFLRDRIKVYATSEDVTTLVAIRYEQGKPVFIIRKDKNEWSDRLFKTK